MHHESFLLAASDTSQLFVNHWFNGQTPKAVVMISHGLAEHSGRYGRFAQALVSAGFEVYAPDQRGHGQTALSGLNGPLGHYADDKGWSKVVADLASLNHHIRKRHPQTPIFLLGHSMGSYISQAYLVEHSRDVHGAILSGSNFQPPALYQVAGLIARLERFRQGPRGQSALLEFLSFGSFNKAFKPTRTDFDWLSRDPAEVDAYINDPLCGFRASNQLWIDMLGGLRNISLVSNLAKIDPQLPLLVVGGARDPVSDGKRLNDLASALRKNGNASVQLKIYPDARHELLNETNRDEVTRDLIQWLANAAPPKLA
jgi:alpha-beta hydrolase superfamily lysophospholipase